MTEEGQAVEKNLFLRDLRNYLRFHQQIGLDSYPFALPEDLAPKKGGQTCLSRPSASPAARPAGSTKPAAAGRVARAEALAEMDGAVASCRNCRRGLQKVSSLAGEGKAGAALVIVVEQTLVSAAGEKALLHDEDRDLLEKMLAAIKVSTDMVYIAPLVKCSPAGGTATSREERAACLPLLEGQLAALRPRAVLVFGEEAARALFKTEQPFFHLRGKVEEIRGLPAVATYHPGQLRSEPALKQMAWQDLQLLQRVLAGGKRLP